MTPALAKYAFITGTILMFLAGAVLTFLLFRYYSKRSDVKPYKYAFVLIGAYVLTRVINNFSALIDTYYAMPEVMASLSLFNGVVTTMLAYHLWRVYPKLLSIPNRQEIESAFNLYRAHEEVALEGNITTKEGAIIKTNKQFAKMFGYEDSEVIGKTALHFIHPEDLPMVEKKIQTKCEKAYKCRGVKKDTSILYLEVRGKNIKINGEHVRVTAIKDITHETRLIEKLESELSFYFSKILSKEYQNQIIKKVTESITEGVSDE